MAVALVVVDVANVIGSRPDGWWRDRAAAATRLRDELGASVAAGHPIGDLSAVELVLVVEGKAGGVGSVPGVEVISAPGSGDDAIVDVVRARGQDRPVVVVTADRELRGRVVALGATAHGPRWLRR
ncbi:hypothetical protein Ais01nite_55090 [Asanoa ishikariensis]|uniref:YacP-like NYN domain-containing protein n=1 Tax=Asanoa ishikariensis TaxID=137265 RepID=A0A1H3TTY4_9ACTN|nr:hypothetical protein [Asanoa ishikariensis]GIF67474.1 hypothetical protein Ais01nite_55090 [Asanoa ishikariensis]SDZ53616.1 hypothetical protein SAMN05421684_6370 [Asanoa ishikariensis]